MIQVEHRDIFRKMAAHQCPARVQIETTRQCNLNCTHCMIIHSAGAATAQALSFDEFESLLRQLREAGTFHINLTGGEVLVRPDAMRLLEAAFRERFLVTLQTNGTLLEPGHVSLLARHARQVRQVGISLYAMDPDVHDAVTRSPGSHAGALRAIHLLRGAGLPVVAVLTLTRTNAGEFDAVERFAAGHGLMFQFNTLIAPRDDGGSEPTRLRLDESLLCRLPQPWETFMDEERQRLDASEMQADSPLSAWCSMGATACYITATGDVRPCSVVNISAGNVRNTPFREIWDHGAIFQKLRAFRLGEFQCHACEHFPLCHPCPGLAYLEHGDFRVPAKEICRINSVFFNKRRTFHDAAESAANPKTL